MDTGISRAEYEEHNRRMDDEHHRMNRRIELLEEEVRQISQIASSVEKLANNMEGMLKEQQEQGEHSRIRFLPDPTEIDAEEIAQTIIDIVGKGRLQCCKGRGVFGCKAEIDHTGSHQQGNQIAD